MEKINKNARSVKVIFNIAANYISQVIRIALEFVTRTLFIRFLGAELLGVAGLFTNILLVLSLSELGLSTVVSYSYYKPLAENDNNKLAALTGFYKKIYNCIAIFVVVAGIILLPVMRTLVVSEGEIAHLNWIYILYVINTAVSYMFVYKTIIFNADQKNYVIKKWDTIFAFVQSALQILVLVLFKNYLVYLAVMVFATFMKNCFCAFEAKKQYPFLNSTVCLEVEEKKKIISNIKAGFIYKLSGVLLNGTDNILISKMIGTIWVGYLANYNMIVTTISTFVVMTFNAFTASVGNLAVKESEQKKYDIFNMMFCVASWLARICVPCIFLLSDDFIFLWVGEEFVIDKWNLVFKAGMSFLSITLNPIYSYREALGLYLKLKYVMLIAAILNIVLSIIMGLYWGMPGILLASLVAMLVTYVWYEPKVLYEEYFNKSCIEYFRKQLVNILVIISVIFIADFIFGLVNTPISWGTWIIKAVVICLLSVVGCVIADFRTKECRMIVNQLKSCVRYFA